MSLIGSAFVAALLLCPSGMLGQRVVNSSEHRNAERALPQTVAIPAGSVTAKVLKQKLAGERTGISLAVADFDSDSTPDLLSGYATAQGGVLLLQRGSPRAQAPGPDEQEMIRNGQLVTPYVESAEAIDVPVRPDLLKTADVMGFGHSDVLVAAKGDDTVWVLPSTGHGTFLAARALVFAGPISALGTWRSPATGQMLVIAAVCGSSGCGLQMLDRDGKTAAFVATKGKVTSFGFARINGGGAEDLLAIAGGQALLVDGDSLLSGEPKVQAVGPRGSVAAVSGSFLYSFKGTPQLAILGADATLHLYDRAPLNPHQITEAEIRAMHLERRQAQVHHTAFQRPANQVGKAWQEVETTANFGPGGSEVLLLNGHLAATEQEELTLLAGGQFVQLTHPSVVEGDVRVTTPVMTVDATDATITAATTARVSADGRLGLVALDSKSRPMVALPAIYHTFNVNTTADGTPTTTTIAYCSNGQTNCTLRSALAASFADLAANKSSGKVDTINIPAGTYVMSATNNGSAKDYHGDVNYHFIVNAGVNLVGASQTTTIINANSKDNIFDISSGTTDNGGGSSTLSNYPVFVTNMTLENGVNTNYLDGNSSAYNISGGLIDWQPYGAPSSLTINSSTFMNGMAKYGVGGAIAGYGGTAVLPLEMDNCLVTGNGSSEGGGGVYSLDISTTLNGTTISNNVASPSVNPSDDESGGQGGGYGASGGASDTFTNSIFTGNSAQYDGGGAYESNNLTMSGTTFSSNTTAGFGGGLELLEQFTSSMTWNVTTSNFTGNAASGGDGGGVCLDFAYQQNQVNATLTLSYSRLHGNTATGGNTGVAIGCGGNSESGSVTLTASNNWWGCNGAATGTGCDTEGTTSGSTGTISGLTLSPYTTLVETLSTTTPMVGNMFTATGGLGQNSSGTVYTAANDAGYDGVAATNLITQNGGGMTNSSASTLTGSAAIATTATATNGGAGTAKITVDGTTVSAAFTISGGPLALGVSSTHTGNFKAGTGSNPYTLTVSDTSSMATSGTVTLTDTLPGGFIATAMSGTGWTCSVSSVSCTRSDSLAGNSSYAAVTLTVFVPSGDAGTYSNSVSASGGGATSTATSTDSTTIVGLPTLSEAFNPTSVAVNVNSTATFTVGNPAANTVSLTGVGFTDTLPAGLIVATPNGASTTCSGGSVSAIAGSSNVNFSGATIAPGATCTVTVSLVSAAAGSYTNTTGNVTSSNSTAGNTATATLTVTAATLGVTSTHTGNFEAGSGSSPYTLTVSNTSSTASSGTVTLTDTLPSGFTATVMTGSGWTCTLSSVSCTRSDVLAGNSSYPVVTLTVSVSSADAGSYSNSVSASGGGAASAATGTDSTIVVGMPTIAEVFNPTSVAPGVNSTATFTLGNPAANTVSLTGVGFTDSLPSGLLVASPNGASTNCSGGSVSAIAGSSTVTLSGATIASGATCTVTVAMVATSAGSYTNTTGTVTSSNAMAGSTASATLTVAVAPTMLVYTSPPPSTLTAGGNAGTVQVTLEDASGNIATSNSSTAVALTVTGPNSYSQLYMATAANGVASFNLTAIAVTAPGSYTYTATASGLTSASASETVSAGSVAAFVVTGLGSSTSPGASGTASVKAVDAYGNTAISFTGTVTLSSSDTVATFSPTSYTYVAGDAGIHSFTVTLNTGGTQSVTATSGAFTGSETGIVVGDAIWVLNANSTIVRLTEAGVQTTSAGSSSGTATFGSIAFDNAGNVWSALNSGNVIQEYSKTGTALFTSASGKGGLNTPTALFIDGLGYAWVANGNSSVSALNAAGTVISPTAGFTGGSLSAPSGILVDSTGSVWVSNHGNNSVTRIIGVAGPVVTPTVTATTNNTLGKQP